MMRRLQNSWALIKASFGVLVADKELVVFPIVSSIGVLVVMATFAIPMFFSGFFDSLISERFQVLGVVVGFAFYVVQYFVIIFANAALIGAAMIRLQGGDPTVGDGFRVATRHVVSILGYALISATVGMILRWISDRGKTLGRVASSILGMAWTVGTYLVVPILVVEGVGPVEAIKLSVAHLKETWGEQIAGNFSIGTVFGLLIVGVVIVGVIGIGLAFSIESIPLITVSIILVVTLVLLLGLLSSTLNGIYVAAVYLYATEGQVSEHFSDEMVTQAFLPKG